jgi:hypothetical protein
VFSKVGLGVRSFQRVWKFATLGVASGRHPNTSEEDGENSHRSAATSEERCRLLVLRKNRIRWAGGGDKRARRFAAG